MLKTQIDIPKGPGTYVLILSLSKNRTITIGKLGSALWHIDYLRSATRVTGVIIASGKKVREHLWASRLAQPPPFRHAC